MIKISGYPIVAGVILYVLQTATGPPASALRHPCVIRELDPPILGDVNLDNREPDAGNPPVQFEIAGGLAALARGLHARYRYWARRRSPAWVRSGAGVPGDRC
jgi:hypothetical protein